MFFLLSSSYIEVLTSKQFSFKTISLKEEIIMNLNIKDGLVKKQNSLSSFDDIQKTSYYLANDIARFLGEQLDELNISSYIFRSGIERALVRVLNSLSQKVQPVVLYPDSIPGFSLMVFRKSQANEDVKKAHVTRSPVEEVKELDVMETVIGRYFEKNKQQVLVIENDDMIFALFPVADTKKNLKSLELYITF